MRGPTIIGLGNDHYKYKSGHEGDGPVVGFSPRKTVISLYIYSDKAKKQDNCTNSGKIQMAKACIYIHKLVDIDISVLKELCIEYINLLSEHHQCSCKTRN